MIQGASEDVWIAPITAAGVGGGAQQAAASALDAAGISAEVSRHQAELVLSSPSRTLVQGMPPQHRNQLLARMKAALQWGAHAL